jgi:hypothetical protein
MVRHKEHLTSSSANSNIFPSPRKQLFVSRRGAYNSNWSPCYPLLGYPASAWSRLLPSHLLQPTRRTGLPAPTGLVRHSRTGPRPSSHGSRTRGGRAAAQQRRWTEARAGSPWAGATMPIVSGTGPPTGTGLASAQARTHHQQRAARQQANQPWAAHRVHRAEPMAGGGGSHPLGASEVGTPRPSPPPPSRDSAQRVECRTGGGVATACSTGLPPGPGRPGPTRFG